MKKLILYYKSLIILSFLQLKRYQKVILVTGTTIFGVLLLLLPGAFLVILLYLIVKKLKKIYIELNKDE